jgi:type IV pilus assembly protein PilA
MLSKLRRRFEDEQGFTLIELLVVILIIGILAAIAIPSFINQRGKAQDATAKADARTAQTAMETYYTDNQNYSTDATGVKAIEPALNNANVLSVTGGTDNYSVSVTSKGTPATVYTITRASGGTVTRTCDQHGKGGCKATADSSGNYW